MKKHDHSITNFAYIPLQIMKFVTCVGTINKPDKHSFQTCQPLGTATKRQKNWLAEMLIICYNNNYYSIIKETLQFFIWQHSEAALKTANPMK